MVSKSSSAAKKAWKNPSFLFMRLAKIRKEEIKLKQQEIRYLDQFREKTRKKKKL